MMGSIFSAIIQVLMEGKLTAGTGDNITWIIGEIVLVVHTSIYHSEFSVGDVTDAMEEDRLKLLILQGGVVIGLCTTFQVSSIGRKGPVLVQPVPDRILGVHLTHLLRTVDRPRMVMHLHCKNAAASSEILS
jgi:hypothetical protein